MLEKLIIGLFLVLVFIAAGSMHYFAYLLWIDESYYVFSILGLVLMLADLSILHGIISDDWAVKTKGN